MLFRSIKKSLIWWGSAPRLNPLLFYIPFWQKKYPFYTPNANMADHSVGARDESHESEVSQALMFCLTMLLQRSLDFSLCFALSTRFCVPECHRKGVKSSTAKKVFFSSVVSFVFNGKLKRRRPGVNDRRRNCLSSGSKILENE